VTTRYIFGIVTAPVEERDTKSCNTADLEGLLIEAPPVETDVVAPSPDCPEVTGPTTSTEQSSTEHAAAGEHGELVEALSRIHKQLGESQRLLDRQQVLADRLHAENQTLRAGELRSAQLPLVRDVLRLYDDVGRMRDGAEEEGDLRIVRETLADTLVRNGVVPFEPDRGDDFDSHTHSVVGVEATLDEGLDRTVAEVVKQGFRWESGEVIRVAEVTAYRFQRPT
jgi:molecular chaperone GrpE (heat shock protein)